MNTTSYSTQKNYTPLKSTSIKSFFIGLLSLSLLFSGCIKHGEPPFFPFEIHKVNHVVVIYLENHSFDNLYGQFAGANGLSNATKSEITQVDSLGNPYTFLPPVPGSTAFPTNLPNNYFNIDQYVPNDMMTPDVLHRYYQEQMQIDGGKMDKYALYNNSGGLSQGYYKTSMLPLLSIVQQYTFVIIFITVHLGVHF